MCTSVYIFHVSKNKLSVNRKTMLNYCAEGITSIVITSIGSEKSNKNDLIRSIDLKNGWFNNNLSVVLTRTVYK